MALTNKTRKLLWGHSGNRCAFCKCELIMGSTPEDDESVVGEECHIVARESGGPRNDLNFPKKKLDQYDNLILLCRVHHKMVDDQENTYSVEHLRRIKKEHEQWVCETLNLSCEKLKAGYKNQKDSSSPKYLSRLTTGKELINVLSNSHAYDFDHDELESEDEVDLVGGFLQNAQDWGELYSELESGGRIEASYDLQQAIKELEASDFLVFGEYVKRKIKFKEEIFDWNVAVLRVVRSTNPLYFASLEPEESGD